MPARLEALQALLADSFRRGSPVPEDPALAAACAEHVAGNDRLSPAEQVDIYRRQYWLRHLKLMADDFPGLKAALGGEAFEAFCRAYLEACPPASYALRELGGGVVSFADTYPGFPEGKERLARELVRYERAHGEIWSAAEPPRLDAARVAAMTEDDWATARVILSPLLRRLRVEHPVHRIRDAARAGEEPPLSPQRAHLLLYRLDLRVLWQEIEPSAFALLEALARGVPLIPACEEVASALDEAEAETFGGAIQGWFAQWANRGLIVGIEGTGSVEHP